MCIRPINVERLSEPRFYPSFFSLIHIHFYILYIYIMTKYTYQQKEIDIAIDEVI